MKDLITAHTILVFIRVQVQIRFTKTSGARHLRVINVLLQATDDRELMEKVNNTNNTRYLRQLQLSKV